GVTQVLTIITAVYDSLITLLTGGRIWWMARQVGRLRGGDVLSKYKVFIATILESGLLFSATLLASVISQLSPVPRGKIIPFDLTNVAVQMAGVAPTLIVVRIAYGQSMDSVQQMVSTLQFAEGGNNSQQPSTAIRGNLDPQQSMAEVEERGPTGRFEMDKPPLTLNVASNVV
ncbi:hypothetical protein PQX77_005774, partial [Marasmius sp. AFHP31]